MSQLLEATAALTALQAHTRELPTWASVALGLALSLIFVGGALILLAGRVASFSRQVARIRADIAVGQVLVARVKTSATNDARDHALENYLRFRDTDSAKKHEAHPPASS